MIVYLAHPITGLAYDDVMTYFNTLEHQLRLLGYMVLSPMRGKSYLRTEKELKPTGYQIPASTDHAIIERDSWMVSLANIVLVDLTGAEKVSIGCMMELAWAYRQHKHTIVVMPEDNPHRHAFVLEAADIVFDHMIAALEYLGDLI